MTKNRLLRVEKEKAMRLVAEAKKTVDIKCVVLEGEQVHTRREYFEVISKAFQFPRMVKNSFDAYLDWIRDLWWLKEQAVSLFIMNYDAFMNEDLEGKDIVIRTFIEDVLPWWEHDVKNHVVEGKPMRFMVYLAD